MGRELSDEAHVYLCRPRWAQEAGLLERYHDLLSPDERVRASKFRFEKDAHAFTVSRALLRTTLSHYSNVAPSAWRFRTNAYGRPEIDPGAGLECLRFNLSHTQGLIACVIARSVEVGIDVEVARTMDDVIALATRFFSPREAAFIRAASAERRVDDFLAIWTLKEAYVKARGMGLSLSLQGFAFQLSGNVIDVRFESAIEDCAADWCFTLMRPAPLSWLGLAVRAGNVDELKIVPRWYLPLKGGWGGESSPFVVATSGSQ